METGPDAVSSASAEKADQQSADLHNTDMLAACLACDLCREVLKDPMVSPECMHRCESAQFYQKSPCFCLCVRMVRQLLEASPSVS